MKGLIKYYLIIGPIYLIEILIFYISSEMFNNIYVLNFLIRGSFVLLISLILKNIVFTSVKNFYSKFFILCMLNPLFSSFFLGVIFSMMLIDLVYAKLLADIIVSVIFYFLLLRI